MTLEISTFTDEYIRVAVYTKEDGTAVNPTSDVVEMAFMLSGSPDVLDWLTAEWETDATTTPDTYYARVLSDTLGVGSYEVWVRITDNPETIVRRVGPMIVS